ncbi:MAG TPA: hypothetical protein VKR52_08850 [Terracidiphilus sp.]|nr:hypothetical protein [Terracidiphilus sp.]
MKFSLARRAASMIASVLISSCWAQTAPSTPSEVQTQEPVSSGKVIFSRSTDANGNVTTQVGPAANAPKIEMAKEPVVDDDARRAATITALDLDVRLNTASHQIAVRSLVTVRNSGKVPLTHVPLQVSSSLNWEQIRVTGKSVSFTVATLNSDADHTGRLHEAAVPLGEPLAPGATVNLDAAYSGEIVSAAQRLLAIGTPEDLAVHSDWDEISVPFTGLRGFGNVVWYPVSSVPEILGDGARLFDEIGRQKLQMTGTHFTLHLTVEYPHGQPPTVAAINGHQAVLSVHDSGGLDQDVAGTATAGVENQTLGFEAPSIFVADRKQNSGQHLSAWALPEDQADVLAWNDAASAVAPFIQNWLGSNVHSQLMLIDLPDPKDAPFETGNLLAVSLHAVDENGLENAMVHALTHTYTQRESEPPPAWLSEGVAAFLESLWVEKYQGRERALDLLEANRAALALAEPSSPGESAGEPLARAISPVYYRTKAAYVLWMLRELAGDDVLRTALKQLYSATPIQPESAKSPAGNALADLLRQAGVQRDLSWFFADWVNADKGLPDLSITSVFPNAAKGGTYLVAVNVANAGYAAAEVPITVRTAKTQVTQQVMVPARGNVVQRILVIALPTQVQVNDGSVPETQASVHVTDIHADAASTANSSSPPQ